MPSWNFNFGGMWKNCQVIVIFTIHMQMSSLPSWIVIFEENMKTLDNCYIHDPPADVISAKLNCDFWGKYEIITTNNIVIIITISLL